jgi:hypothetical protein
MAKLIEEIKYDLNFLKSHTLQPKWFKVLKVFILLGFLLGYTFLFSLGGMIVFLLSFLCLMLIVHFVYRSKTNKYTTSWLDFVVLTDKDQKPERIGKYYYPVVVMNALISFIISQVLT